jgi:hypothetical protein
LRSIELNHQSRITNQQRFNNPKSQINNPPPPLTVGDGESLPMVSTFSWPSRTPKAEIVPITLVVNWMAGLK